jgi:hypothetical protein
VNESPSYILLAARNQRLVRELERLRAALAWYADEDRYSVERPRVLESATPALHSPFAWDATDAQFDAGERARAALNGSAADGGGD